ncbi:L,D-transpeptidase [Chthonobacter rhizosphaerae]|uniref:L,D-transpeptidase n=1 Tax=Chthonobacter rhizosphaerae TaxID=2735553 RepID=UPI0015EED883|nr:L,D-transpeptidase [Chthonobacter rhizosphaerae]
MTNKSLPIVEQSRRSAVSRRVFLAGLPLALSACAGGGVPMVPVVTDPRRDPQYLSMYGAMPDEQFPIPAIDLRQIDPRYFRREVGYDSEEAPGTIVIEPHDKYLYLVQPDGRAMRYGIGVGREGFGWSGRAVIRRKAEWPSWHPPVEMQARDEKAKLWADGMPGGLQNPLGARALYLYQGGRDTLYRIHGTNEPWTIGSNVSSGCIRMINQDAIDLYRRVPTGTEVVVLEGNPYFS